MANGLPVIVSDQVGIHHEITRVGPGLVVHCDANEVHQALVQMLDSQSMRDHMAQNGQRLAAEFSQEADTVQTAVGSSKVCPTKSSCRRQMCARAMTAQA